VSEIYNFGKWIFVSSILGFLINQGDRLLLGGIISSEMLGVYTVAFFLANAAKDVLSSLISSVFFPVLSKIFLESPESVKPTYYNLRIKIDAITFFLAGFLFSSGQLVISFLYDDRYQDAGWMLQILALSLLGVGSRLSGQLFLVAGKSKIFTIITAAQVISLYSVTLFFSNFYSFEAVIWSLTLTPMLVRVIFTGCFMHKFFFFDIGKEVLCAPLFGVGLFFGIAAKIILG
jgi:O-antigen/teichoic acid export membrane protein